MNTLACYRHPLFQNVGNRFFSSRLEEHYWQRIDGAHKAQHMCWVWALTTPILSVSYVNTYMNISVHITHPQDSWCSHLNVRPKKDFCLSSLLLFHEYVCVNNLKTVGNCDI